MQQPTALNPRGGIGPVGATNVQDLVTRRAVQNEFESVHGLAFAA